MVATQFAVWILLVLQINSSTNPQESTEPDNRARAVANRQKEVASLAGVGPVRVLVEAVPQDLVDAGLTEERLTTKAELHLRKSGIKVQDFEPGSTEALYVRVTGLVSNSGVSVYVLELEFRQLALLVNQKPNLTLVVATWRKGSIAMAHRSRLKNVVDEDLTEKLDSFINDYSAANAQK
jgi:hypothetical protein